MSLFEDVLEWGYESGHYESMSLDYEDFDDTQYFKEDVDVVE